MFQNNWFSLHQAMEENGSIHSWIIFGKHVPKLEVVFFSQIIILYLVIVSAVINLSIQNGDPTLWSTLLGSSIGYVLPNPNLKRHKFVSTQSNQI